MEKEKAAEKEKLFTEWYLFKQIMFKLLLERFKWMHEQLTQSWPQSPASLDSSWRPQWATTVNNSNIMCGEKWSHRFRCQYFLTSLFFFFLFFFSCSTSSASATGVGPHAKIVIEVDLAAPDRSYKGKLLSVAAGAVNLAHPSSLATIIWLQISELKCVQGWMGGYMVNA